MAKRIRVKIRSKPDRKSLVLYFVHPVTGKEVQKSAGTADSKEAERSAALWERELAESGALEGCGWEHFRNRFEREHLSGLAPKTRKCYATALNAFERVAKVSNLHQVTTSFISEFKAELLEAGHPPTTVGSYMTHVRAAVNWATEVGLMTKAPKVKVPKTSGRKVMRGRPITEAEYLAMVSVAPPDYARFLHLLWFSGFRLQEAMRVSWDRLPVLVKMDGKPYPHTLFLSEGHKSRQDDACPMPKDFHAWLSTTPLSERRGVIAPILNLKGSKRIMERVSEAISELGKAAGIVVDDDGKWASAHDYRRSFGTRWAAQVRPLTLQRMMRHANLSTTLRYYIGLSSADAGQELWNNNGPENGPKEASGTAKAG